MRELKFRVWDKIHEKYREPMIYDILHEKIVVRLPIETLKKGEFLLEQYTGLEDKNGEKIYDGDIVEALIDGMWSTSRSTVSFGKAKWRLEVLYDDIRFMDVFKTIGSKSNPDRIYYLFDKELSELEVIGNVRENPELLEEER